MKNKAKKYTKIISKSVIPEGMKIDVVISSACPFIEMLFGYELKKKLNCKWICDFRDLPFEEDNCHSTHIEKQIMKKTLKDSDAITVVTNDAKRKLIEWFDFSNNKVSTITNGFSLKDKREPIPSVDNKLHLVHTGSLYGGKRRADLLFEAINLLDIEYKSQIMFDCAGGNNSSLLKTANKYNCSEIMNDHGFLSRNEALNLQLCGDCLVALVEQFSLPAKMFEYVLNQKPIICIVIGDKNMESQARPFIEKLNVGRVYEEKNREKDALALADYLRSLVCKKKNGEPLEYMPNSEEVRKYDHDYLTGEFEKLMFDIKGKTQ